jgi:hypothetical protein
VFRREPGKAPLLRGRPAATQVGVGFRLERPLLNVGFGGRGRMTTGSIDASGTLAPREVERSTRREPRQRGATAPPPHVVGALWFAGWLFTIGLVKVVWWKAVLAIVVWPYFLGGAMR